MRCATVNVSLHQHTLPVCATISLLLAVHPKLRTWPTAMQKCPEDTFAHLVHSFDRLVVLDLVRVL
eukprot:6249054-Amphidinium_carterae.1